MILLPRSGAKGSIMPTAPTGLLEKMLDNPGGLAAAALLILILFGTPLVFWGAIKVIDRAVAAIKGLQDWMSEQSQAWRTDTRDIAATTEARVRDLATVTDARVRDVAATVSASQDRREAAYRDAIERSNQALMENNAAMHETKTACQREQEYREPRIKT